MANRSSIVVGHNKLRAGAEFLANLFSRRLGHFSAALLILTFLFLALTPFDWQPPRNVRNGAQWTDHGSLLISTEGVAAAGPAHEWVEAAKRAGGFRVRLRVRPLGDLGPIFSCSDWAGNERNVMLSQAGADLVIAVRTTESDVAGRPPFVVTGALDGMRWRDIDLVVDQTLLSLRLDGEEVRRAQLPASPLSGWRSDNHMQVTLANEVDGRRPWLGEFSVCRVEAGEFEVDFIQARALHVPEIYQPNLKFNSRLSFEDRLDCLLNFLAFVPLGFVMASFGGKRRSAIGAILVCAIVSGGVELLQGCFDRMPSITDWIMNTSGATFGALLALWGVTRTRRSTAS